MTKGGVRATIADSTHSLLSHPCRDGALEVVNLLNPRNVPRAETTLTKNLTLVPTTLAVSPQDATGAFSTPRTLMLPEGFRIELFASGFTKPRLLALNDEGVLFVTDAGAGKVMALPDDDNNGHADRHVEVAEELNFPHGIAFHNGNLYIAETGRVMRLRDTNNDLKAETQEVIVGNLPTGGNHVSRTLVFDPQDAAMYVSVGSSCNVCEDDPRRGAVLRFRTDGSDETIFASGLRNAVGLTFHPKTGELWATDNGRDLLGDDTPPEEVNVVREGKHYGWPYYYGQKTADAKYQRAGFCATSEPPMIAMQAHSAPLGLRFYEGEQFPQEYSSKLFVAFHGSWNRREPTGYKVIVADTEGSGVVSDFATGWLVNGKAWGRPVDVITGRDGSLYISDDSAGAIYRVSYSPS